MGKIYLLTLLIICLWGSTSASTSKVLISHKAHLTSIQHSSAERGFTAFASDTIRHRKHKLFAALLAFPLGIFGLHRIYLGTSTGVPILYMATLGGLFGVVPFIDFVLILLCKDVNVYAHNPGVFMWSRKQ